MSVKIGNYTHSNDFGETVLNENLLDQKKSGDKYSILIRTILEKRDKYQVVVTSNKTGEEVYNQAPLKPKTVIGTASRFGIKLTENTWN